MRSTDPNKPPKGPTRREGERLRAEIRAYVAWWRANKATDPVIHLSMHQARALELTGVYDQLEGVPIVVIGEGSRAA